MSSIIVLSTSIIVGLYSLFAAVFWLTWPSKAVDAALVQLIPFFHIAITLFAAALMLFAIHLRRIYPRFGTTLHIAMLLIVLVMGLTAASGYAVAPASDGNLVMLQPLTNTSTSPIPYGLIIALIGFLSLFRRIGPWALMIGGVVLLAAYLLLLVQARTIPPILGALISIGFIFVGNQRYQEGSLQY